MAAVRIRFKVTRIEAHVKMRRGPNVNDKPYYIPTELRTIALQPVYGDDNPLHANTAFWEDGPVGEIRLGVVKAAAWEQFVLGAEYYVDFTRSENSNPE